MKKGKKIRLSKIFLYLLIYGMRGHDNLEISRWATQLTAFGHALPEQRIVVLGMTDRATNAVPGLRFR